VAQAMKGQPIADEPLPVDPKRIEHSLRPSGSADHSPPISSCPA
jgi:hypothetical protein